MLFQNEKKNNFRNEKKSVPMKTFLLFQNSEMKRCGLVTQEKLKHST